MSSYILKKKEIEEALIMEKDMGMAVIVGACLVVLFLVAVKHKAEFILNFCLRADPGGIAICGVTLVLESM